VPRVYVSIGSNIEREQNIRSAIQALQRRYGTLAISSVYETRAVGFDGDNFLNLVVGFDTGDSPETVRATLARIEHEHGRRRDGAPRFSARTLDLDILLYGDLIRHEGGIDVPRAEIRQQAFVLAPLAELTPDTRHPETGETYQTMWEGFTDKSTVLRTVPLELDQ
jgi:2-amino-4-hydroxy-6-hydroxymethyldihydropteridine diphosphokinase